MQHASLINAQAGFLQGSWNMFFGTLSFKSFYMRAAWLTWRIERQTIGKSYAA